MRKIFVRLLIFVIVLAIFSASLFACAGTLTEYEMTLVSPPEQTEYCLGDTVLYTNGLKVKIKNTLTGDEETISRFGGDNRFTIEGFDNLTVGEQTITLTYTADGYSTSVTFTIEVLDVWAEDAKTIVDVKDNLSEAYSLAKSEYEGGANSDDDIESRLYVNVGDSKTSPTITPAVLQPNAKSTMYSRYFSGDDWCTFEYTPVKYSEGKISVAWITLMTTVPVEIHGYDTVYACEYPYTEVLNAQVVDGKYVVFDRDPQIKYCYVLNGGKMSVETIQRNVLPFEGYCIEVKEGRIESGSGITIVVPGYKKITVTI